MVALTVQTLLLMGAAYFIGAALACLIRRSLARPAYQTAERRVDPLPEVVQRNAEAAALARAAPAARPAPPPAPQPVAAPAQTPAPDDSRAGPQAHPPDRCGIGSRAQSAGRQPLRSDRRLDAAGRAPHRDRRWASAGASTRRTGSSRRAFWPRAARPTIPPAGPAARLRIARHADCAQPRSGSRSTAACRRLRRCPGPCPAAASVAAGGRCRSQRLHRRRHRHRPFARRRRPRTTTCSASARSRRRSRARSMRRASRATRRSRNGRPPTWSASSSCLPAGGRIARENWIEQAQILSRGGDTRFSREFDRRAQGDGPRPTKLADAIREQQAKTAAAAAPTDLASLRSVRAPAGQEAPEPGPEAAQRVAAQDRVLRGRHPAGPQAHPRHRRADREEAQPAGRPHLRPHRQLDRAATSSASASRSTSRAASSARTGSSRRASCRPAATPSSRAASTAARWRPAGSRRDVAARKVGAAYSALVGPLLARHRAQQLEHIERAAARRRRCPVPCV